MVSDPIHKGIVGSFLCGVGHPTEREARDEESRSFWIDLRTHGFDCECGKPYEVRYSISEWCCQIVAL